MAGLRTRTSQSDLSVQNEVLERWQPTHVLVDLGVPEVRREFAQMLGSQGFNEQDGFLSWAQCPMRLAQHFQCWAGPSSSQSVHQPQLMK